MTWWKAPANSIREGHDTLLCNHTKVISQRLTPRLVLALGRKKALKDIGRELAELLEVFVDDRDSLSAARRQSEEYAAETEGTLTALMPTPRTKRAQASITITNPWLAI